jgi:hypothetical protein
MDFVPRKPRSCKALQVGVDIDEEQAARHPYRPAVLPVARLHDGTMHDW